MENKDKSVNIIKQKEFFLMQKIGVKAFNKLKVYIGSKYYEEMLDMILTMDDDPITEFTPFNIEFIDEK